MFQHLTRYIAAVLLLAGIAGCSWVRDDLTDCPKGCQVQLKVEAGISTEGGFNAAAFRDEVQSLTLYVFDSNGKFVGHFSEQGDKLKQGDYTVDVPIDPGHYKAVAWTGLEDDHYIVSDLVPGTSTIEDLEVLLERNSENRQDEYLGPVWHGKIDDIEVKPNVYQVYEVPMRKTNNNFVVVLHDMNGNPIKGDTFTYEIQSANGRMAHDHSLLEDDVLKYGAYFVETANLSDYDDTKADDPAINLTVARAELNTLRLVKGNPTRLVIRERAGGKLVLDINLIQYILMTREYYENRVGAKLTDQQYLDYEDKYSLMFTMMPTGSIVNPYALVELRINGWVLRPQDAIL